MRLAARLAPWFNRRRDDKREPISYRAWKWSWQRAPSFVRPTLFERVETSDWDLLVVLDAARYDVLRELADGVVSQEVSPASSTPEFLEEADEREVFTDAIYVSANPQLERKNLSAERVEYLNDRWDDRLDTIPPEAVYDRAIELVRKGESVVAHTLQPHYPHICRIDGDLEPVPGGLHPEETDIEGNDVVQGYLTSGRYSLADVRRSYEICTEFAWREARRAAQELRSEGYTVAITSDHGEAFGEFGFVEHPTGVSIPQLRRVPWVEFRPAGRSSSGAAEDLEDRLRALGYR